MISIDQHGQWPLTVRNFYVVLIMTKLVQLKSDGLEYYLLGFDQGGRKLNMDVYDNLNYRQPFPISFSKNCLGVLVTLEGRGPVSGASVAYTNNRTITEFTIVTDASNAKAKSDLFYIAVGI
jgi:hypothetical protein